VIICPKCKTDKWYFDGAWIECKNQDCSEYMKKYWLSVKPDNTRKTLEDLGWEVK
jgi:hypothetical protein